MSVVVLVNVVLAALVLAAVVGALAWAIARGDRTAAALSLKRQSRRAIFAPRTNRIEAFGAEKKDSPGLIIE